MPFVRLSNNQIRAIQTQAVRMDSAERQSWMALHYDQVERLAVANTDRMNPRAIKSKVFLGICAGLSVTLVGIPIVGFLLSVDELRYQYRLQENRLKCHEMRRIVQVVDFHARTIATQGEIYRAFQARNRAGANPTDLPPAYNEANAAERDLILNYGERPPAYTATNFDIPPPTYSENS